jgi:hypothetical protein
MSCSTLPGARRISAYMQRRWPSEVYDGSSLTFHRIAARPDDGIHPTNAEIQLIFAHWLETPLHQSYPQPGRAQQPARDFSAFGLV